MLEAEPKAKLLWVHGPQPISFRASATAFEQATARLSRLPDVTLYGLEPGPNELLPDAPWAWAARALPWTGSPQRDLAAFLSLATSQSQVLTIERRQQPTAEGLAKGSDHIVRLWASERVLELTRAGVVKNREAAVSLATQYRLVTPVSGAVVLESKAQYDANRLTPVAPATLPTVPEPHEWALALLACVALLCLAWRQRQQPATAA
jgi:hypothetical protein